MKDKRFEFIKIQVVRADGQAELLTLTEPLLVSGRCIITGTGCEHFFTENGLYDGWGMPFSADVAEDNVMEEIMPTIQAIEDGREVIGGGDD